MFEPREPYSAEAEHGVLGAMMQRPELIDVLSTDLQANHFYFEDNAAIFRGILALRHQSKGVDPLTVATQMRPATFASRTGFGNVPSARCCTTCATDADGVAVDDGSSPCRAARNCDEPRFARSAMYWSSFANATSFSATAPPIR